MKEFLDKCIENKDLKAFYELVDNLSEIPLEESNRGPLLFQYSSWDALFNGIIRADCDDTRVYLHSTNCQFLNDPSEVVYGDETIDEVLNLIFRKSSNFRDDHHLNSVYLTSFSLCENELPMWNMYGKNGYGIAVGLDYQVLAENLPIGAKLNKCIYRTDKFQKELYASLANLEVKGKTNDSNEFISYLSKLMSLVKNPAYEYEKEVRLVIQETKPPKYKLCGNLIVPYIESAFPKESLKKIIIGPCNDFNRSTKALEGWLNRMNMQEVEVSYSLLPYR